MGTTLKVIDEVVSHTVEKYVKDYCKQVATHRDGYPIFGCESGIFAKSAMNYMNFEYGLGLEWIPNYCKEQFGQWMFYSAQLPKIKNLLLESGINTSV